MPSFSLVPIASHAAGQSVSSMAWNTSRGPPPLLPPDSPPCFSTRTACSSNRPRAGRTGRHEGRQSVVECSRVSSGVGPPSLTLCTICTAVQISKRRTTCVDRHKHTQQSCGEEALGGQASREGVKSGPLLPTMVVQSWPWWLLADLVLDGLLQQSEVDGEVVMAACHGGDGLQRAQLQQLAQVVVHLINTHTHPIPSQQAGRQASEQVTHHRHHLAPSPPLLRLVV